jgi:SH3 domain
LYRVKATYKYTREDADELSFDVGDIIDVIEYEDPEEQVSKCEKKILYIFNILTRASGQSCNT